jgi:hypothetical protein
LIFGVIGPIKNKKVKMEGPESKPHHILVEEQLERFHWNWEYRAFENALARRYLRYKPRGLEAKRRQNGAELRDRTGYLVNLAIEYGHERFVPMPPPQRFPVVFKMYKRIGKKKEKKKNKILQIKNF